MLKKFFGTAALLAAMAMLPLVTTSCSDDDTPEPEPEPEAPSVMGWMVAYQVEVNDELLQYIDAEVVYTGNDGKEISTPLTTTLWKDSVAFMADEQPENATIHLSPARNATPLPESGEIDLYVKPTVRLYTIYDDKTVKLSTPIAVEFNHSVDVTKFENYLNTNPRLARRVYFLDVNEDGVLYSSGSSISD